MSSMAPTSCLRGDNCFSGEIFFLFLEAASADGGVLSAVTFIFCLTGTLTVSTVFVNTGVFFLSLRFRLVGKPCRGGVEDRTKCGVPAVVHSLSSTSTPSLHNSVYKLNNRTTISAIVKLAKGMGVGGQIEKPVGFSSNPDMLPGREMNANLGQMILILISFSNYLNPPTRERFSLSDF